MYLGHLTIANLYIGMVMGAKMRPGGSGAFLDKMGGVDVNKNFRPIPMSMMDAVTFLVMVIGFAIIVTVVIAAGKKMIEMSRDDKETI
jgi:hypothetical protein